MLIVQSAFDVWFWWGNINSQAQTQSRQHANIGFHNRKPNQDGLWFIWRCQDHGNNDRIILQDALKRQTMHTVCYSKANYLPFYHVRKNEVLSPNKKCQLLLNRKSHTEFPLSISKGICTIAISMDAYAI